MAGDWFKAQRKQRTELLPGQAEFIDWLINPNRDPASQQGYAKEIGCSVTTLMAWKRDPLFQRAWSRRCIDEGVDPTKVKEVVAALHEKAQGGDVRAAQEYLKYVEKATPWSQRTVDEVEDTTSVTELSDAELVALLANQE